MAKEKLEKAKGRIKEAAGDLTDDERLEWEGKADRAAAEVREKVDDLGDKADDVIDKVKDKSQKAINRVNEKMKDDS